MKFIEGAQRAHHVHLKEVSSAFYLISEKQKGVEVGTVAKRRRLAWRGVSCGDCTGGGEIHGMVAVTIWGAKEKRSMSVRCARARGGEGDQKRAAPSPNTSGNGDGRRRRLRAREFKLEQPGGRVEGKLDEAREEEWAPFIDAVWS